MKEKNKNIDKYRHQQLPEPEIPADEAWAHMNGILASGVTPVKGSGLISKFLKYKWVFLSISGLMIVSAIVLIKTAYLPSSEKGLKLKSMDTTSAPIVELGKNMEKITDIAKPTEQAESDEMPPETIGSNLYPKNRKKTVVRTVGEVVDQTREVRSKQLDKSSRQTESAILEENRAAAEKQKKGSLHSPAWPDAMKRADVLKSNNLQNNKQRIINEKSSRVFLIPESKNRRIEEFLASPAVSKSGKNTSAGSDASAVPFLIPISKINKPYQPVHSGTIIKIPQSQANAPARRQASSIQFGPEWGLNSSLINTDYLFAGKDSVNKPALLLIPGIYVSKSWQQHTISFTFSPWQSHFGNGRIVMHAVDSTLSNDSLKTYNNRRLIKASGLNFSMYYHYQAAKILALSAGISYSFFSNALVRKEIENYAGTILPGALTNLNKSTGLAENINPRLFAVKGGVLLTPGRFQVGLNLIVPVTNISRIEQRPLKPLNGQLFLRFNIY